MRSQLALLPIILGLMLPGCVFRFDHQYTIAQRALQINGRAAVIPAGDYLLQTVQVMPGKKSTLRVYIEGDGLAWVRRNRPSTDPTPRDLLVLDLIAKDVYPDKAYIARPCQFIKNSACKTKVWTNLRYSESAVLSLNQALDLLKTQRSYQSLELIGFSGGATMALLAAATRDDIASVRTIAGNLDPHYVNRFHEVSAMPKALNPAHRATSLKAIPQLHFYGTEDPVIPPQVFATYKKKIGNSRCISGFPLTGAGHHHGWREAWEQLLTQPFPPCS